MRDHFYGGPGPDVVRAGPGDVVHAGRGNDYVHGYYSGTRNVFDCRPGNQDVLRLFDDIHRGKIRGCETIRITYASWPWRGRVGSLSSGG